MEISRRLFLTLPAVGARLPFAEWDERAIDKALTDSAWARQATVPFDFQRFGVRTEAYLVIRWASALPVREAMAAERRRAVEPAPAEYMIEVAGFPAIAFPKAAALEEQLLKTAKLSVKGRRAVSAVSCRVPEHGMHLMAELRFPRDAGFTVEDGAIEFTAEAGGLRIGQKFKTRAMVYNGRLEL